MAARGAAAGRALRDAITAVISEADYRAAAASLAGDGQAALTEWTRERFPDASRAQAEVARAAVYCQARSVGYSSPDYDQRQLDERYVALRSCSPRVFGEVWTRVREGTEPECHELHARLLLDVGFPPALATAATWLGADDPRVPGLGPPEAIPRLEDWVASAAARPYGNVQRDPVYWLRNNPDLTTLQVAAEALRCAPSLVRGVETLAPIALAADASELGAVLEALDPLAPHMSPALVGGQLARALSDSTRASRARALLTRWLRSRVCDVPAATRDLLVEGLLAHEHPGDEALVVQLWDVPQRDDYHQGRLDIMRDEAWSLERVRAWALDRGLEQQELGFTQRDEATWRLVTPRRAVFDLTFSEGVFSAYGQVGGAEAYAATAALRHEQRQLTGPASPQARVDKVLARPARTRWPPRPYLVRSQLHVEFDGTRLPVPGARCFTQGPGYYDETSDGTDGDVWVAGERAFVRYYKWEDNYGPIVEEDLRWFAVDRAAGALREVAAESVRRLEGLTRLRGALRVPGV